MTDAMLTRPEEEWLALDPGTTPALVSPDLWEAAQRRLATNTGAATRNGERPYLLRGHIFCAVCGARMYCDTERDGWRVYRCSSRDKAGGAGGARRVPAEAIEARVWARLRSGDRGPRPHPPAVGGGQRGGAGRAARGDRDAATRALDRLTRQQERLVRQLRDADDEDLGALLERELRQIGQERRALRETIAGIDARLSVESAGLAQLGALADFCACVAANLAAFDFER